MTPDYPTLTEIDALAQDLSRRISVKPEIGLILGSGLGPLADSVEDRATVESNQLEGWPPSTVEGHAGRLVVGMLEGKPVFVMQGRVHFYEGQSMPRIGLSVRVMQRMGVETIIITNAAGGVNPEFEPGELMLITDHINLIGMAGHSPLNGPNLEEFGPRFPDMSRVYDPQLSEVAREVAKQEGFTLREGIYICLAGPAFETPADLRFLRMIGVDAVGMSTVPEATVARHGGMRVLGISGISNKANLDGNTIATHEEVLEAGEVIVPKLTALIRGVLRKL
jgi:purine-nucleoside phosphorylase